MLKDVLSKVSQYAIVIESLIFLLLSSLYQSNSNLVKVVNKFGLISTFLSITPLILDLKHIIIPPTPGYLFPH